MKKKILTLCCVMALTVSMISGCGGANNEARQNTETQATEQPAVEKVTPTLMYFISNSDATFDAENRVIDELKSEYADKINFTVINIDEDTEAAKNFPVQGNTPMVIMLNTQNNISAMNPMTYEKDALKTIIENAMRD